MYHLIDLPSRLNLLRKIVEKSKPELVSKLIKMEISSDFVDLYQTINKFQIRWIDSENSEVTGEVRISGSENLVERSGILLEDEINWKLNGEALFTKGTFIPMDYNNEQSCVGVFEELWSSGKLFYYEFGSMFYSLNIGIEAYFELLKHTYGTSYWPRILLIEKEVIFKNSLSDLISTITKINPSFKYDEFMILYDFLIENELESKQGDNG